MGACAGAEPEACIVAGAHDRIDRLFGARADESFGDASIVRLWLDPDDCPLIDSGLGRRVRGRACGEQEVSAQLGRATCIHGLAILTSDVIHAVETFLSAVTHRRGTYWLRKARAVGVSTRCS